MPIITKIEQQKKNEDRYNIYVDNQFYAGAFKELIFHAKLEEGQEVNKDKLETLIIEEMVYKGKEKAFQILDKAPQSEKILRDKLSRRGYDNSTINKVMAFLKEHDFINDEEYARKLVRDKINFGKYGRNRIKQDLYKKKISKDITERVMSEELEHDEQLENATLLAQKKIEKIKDKDRRIIYQKLSSHLAYKGFNYDVIKKAVQTVLAS